MFVFARGHSARFQTLIRELLRRLPPVAGDPIRIESLPELRDRHGAVHAGAFLRERRMRFDAGLVNTPNDLARIFMHELFHFAWLRLGNPLRKSYEELLEWELRVRARGELGWSAEWRKNALSAADRTARTRRWREYCCESFCDSAAWLFSGVKRHPEFTLAARFRARRRAWFGKSGATRRISI